MHFGRQRPNVVLMGAEFEAREAKEWVLLGVMVPGYDLPLHCLSGHTNTDMILKKCKISLVFWLLAQRQPLL